MDAGFRELLSSVDHGDINDGIKEVWRTTSGDIGKLIKALLPGSHLSNCTRCKLPLCSHCGIIGLS